MAQARISNDPYQAAFDQFMIEAQYYLGEAQAMFSDFGTGEKLLGLSAFAMFVMFLIVSKSRKKEDPGSNGRQFTGALVLVMIFAFGAGWTLDTGNGSMAYLFGR